MIDASTAQAVMTVGIPTLAVLIGILVNNSRLSDLRAHMDARFGAVDARFGAVERIMEAKFATSDANLRRVEEVLDARLTRIEHELKLR